MEHIEYPAEGYSKKRSASQQEKNIVNRRPYYQSQRFLLL